MAFTKVTGPGIHTLSNILSHNIDSSGIITATSFVGSGANLTGVGVGTADSINTSGIITATTLDGNLAASKLTGALPAIDGANLTGLPAGLGTALSAVKTNPLNLIYYTNNVLSIGATITINAPDAAKRAYSAYADIKVEDGFDLIVADGDDFIPDILNIGLI